MSLSSLLLVSLLAAPALDEAPPAPASAPSAETGEPVDELPPSVLDEAVASPGCQTVALALDADPARAAARAVDDDDAVPRLLALLSPSRCEEVRAAAARLLALRLSAAEAPAQAWRALTGAALDDPSERVRQEASAALAQTFSCEARAAGLRVPLDEVTRLALLGVPACEGRQPSLADGTAPLDPAESPADAPSLPSAGVAPPSLAIHPNAGEAPPQDEGPAPPGDAKDADDTDEVPARPLVRRQDEHFWLGATLGASVFPQGPLGSGGVLAGWALDDQLGFLGGVSGLVACAMCSDAEVSRLDLRFEAGLYALLLPDEALSPLLRLSFLLNEAHLTFLDRHAASLQMGGEIAVGLDWAVTPDAKALLELGVFALSEVDGGERRAGGAIPAAPTIPPLSSLSFGLALRGSLALVL